MRTRITATIALTAAMTAALTSLLASPAASTVAPLEMPPANTGWDYQISRPYAPPDGVTVVSRDREAAPLAGGYTICYVNAYQTQEAEVRWWKNHHRNLLLKRDGKLVVDSYWGEILLDIRTPAKRKAIARIVGRWITGCAADGFDAVEPDNLDSWTRSKRLITKDDAFAFARRLASRAHAVGLPIGQKNAAGQTEQGHAAGFDFVVAEECGRYRECGAYMDTYGNQVYVVEYRRQDFQYSCDRWGDELSIILRDRQVTAPGSEKYVYDAC